MANDVKLPAMLTEIYIEALVVDDSIVAFARRVLSSDDAATGNFVDDISLSFAYSNYENDKPFFLVSIYETISASALFDFVVIGRKA